MAKVIDYDSVERNFQKSKKINPPPPDVVEAARRLMTDFADMQDVELVCEWVLSQK